MGTSLYDRYGQPPTGAWTDFDRPAPGVLQVVFFEPPWPSDLCDGPELWVAATGGPEWGAGTVLFSEDDDLYAPVERVRRATLGHLLDPLPATADAVTHLDSSVGIATCLGGEFPPFSLAAMFRKQSLLFVGGAEDYELVAYTAANLRATREGDARIYDLTGFLRRGLYGSRPRPWPVGTLVLRCDRAVAIPLERRLLGWDVYVKILSENTSGEGQEDAQDVEPIIVRLARSP
jgi:hypothetical protein